MIMWVIFVMLPSENRSPFSIHSCSWTSIRFRWWMTSHISGGYVQEEAILCVPHVYYFKIIRLIRPYYY